MSKIETNRRISGREWIDMFGRAVERAGREASIRYDLDRHPNPNRMTREQKVAADIRSVVSCYVQGIPFERRLAMREMKRMSSKEILSIFRQVVEEPFASTRPVEKADEAKAGG